MQQYSVVIFYAKESSDEYISSVPRVGPFIPTYLDNTVLRGKNTVYTRV